LDLLIDMGYAHPIGVIGRPQWRCNRSAKQGVDLLHEQEVTAVSEAVQVIIIGKERNFRANPVDRSDARKYCRNDCRNRHAKGASE